MWSKRRNYFTIEGHCEYKATTSANSAVGWAEGPVTIKFNDGHSLELTPAKTEIAGLMVGERTCTYIDSVYIKDRKNNLYVEISFNPSRSSGLKSWFGGGQVNNDPGDYFEGVISMNEHIDYKNTRHKLHQGEDYISKIHGRFTTEMFVDDQRVWHIDGLRGFELRYAIFPLPSDCRFRQDLASLIDSDEIAG